jgi:hypothetical protein
LPIDTNAALPVICITCICLALKGMYLGPAKEMIATAMPVALATLSA